MATSGRICSYSWCRKSCRNTPELRRFSFPVNEPLRLAEWIENSGNMELSDSSTASWKGKFICGDHFPVNKFIGNKLTKDAVPMKCSNLKDVVHCYHAPSQYANFAEACSGASTSTEVQYLTPSPSSSGCTTDPVEDESTLKQIQNIPTRFKRKREIKSGQHGKLKRQKVSSIPRDITSLPPFPQALTRMQLYHKPKTAWLGNEKVASLSLFYKSPSTYKFLRKKGMVLPSVSSLSSWLKSCRFQPGINKSFFNFIRLKIEKMKSADKECVIIMDEMAVKQCLEFSTSKDILEGYEDLGELGRRPLLAKQVLVVMVWGIYSNWKVPLSYYFSHTGVKSEFCTRNLLL